MATPSEKAPELDEFLQIVFGKDRIASITNNMCNWCGEPAEKFKDNLSRREYRISGLCQNCQDQTFGRGDDD